MHRKNAAFLLSIVLIILFSSPVQAQRKTYQDPQKLYTVWYPDFMSLYDMKQSNSFCVICNEKGLVISIAYSDMQKVPGTNIQKLMPHYPFIEQTGINYIKQSGFQVNGKKDYAFKGIPSVLYDIGQVNKNNADFSGNLLMFTAKQKLFMIMLKSWKRDYKKNFEIFRNTIDTIKF
jgi:hypothetical protein